MMHNMNYETNVSTVPKLVLTTKRSEAPPGRHHGHSLDVSLVSTIAKLNRLHSTTSNFRVTCYVENNPKMTLNTMRSKVPNI